jgi:Na+/H+-dicarboxylate symporter
VKKRPLHHLTLQIVIALIAGIITGIVLKFIPSTFIQTYFTNGLLDILGKLFLDAMKMLVVPVVFVSLVCGTLNLNNGKALGRMMLKTLMLYLITTAIAITLGLIISSLFSIGSHANLSTAQTQLHIDAISSPKAILLHIIPVNPIQALATGNMLQIIFFALLIGIAIAFSGKRGKPIANLFESANAILMKLIHLIMMIAPIGVYALIASIFARVGFSVIVELLSYFFTVVLTLVLQAVVVYSLFIIVLARLNPVIFFKKLYALMVFAFSTASSNASIPITLETVVEKLGVKNSIASFTVPLGATINMDGTAIMQGIATVFIANLYHVNLSFTQYLIVILTATLASIGTAGVPGVGLITLAMVLKQVGLPIEGIALIMGVDRLLDMLRTAVNVTGDSMVALVVGKSEGAFSEVCYKERSGD